MSDALPFQPKFTGQPVPRVEDPVLLTGRARFVDDLQFPGMLHIAMLRSPMAHARITQIDTSAARSLPGVACVLTGAEIKELTRPLGGMPSIGPGWSGYAIAADKVRYTGEIVAAVAATSRHIAEDAAELIKVDYEFLDPVVDPVKAADEESALLFEDKGTNVLFQKDYVYGDPDAVLEAADLVVTGEFRFPRVSGNPLETNGLISRWDTMADELTCWCNAQSPGGSIAGHLKDPPGRDHIIAQPHGGSFGTKLYLLKYQLIAALVSRASGGRYVKYIEDRMEHLLASGTHAWDRRYEAAFGFTRDGRCTVMTMRCLNDAGASSENSAPSMCWKPIVMLTGPYRVDHVRYDLTAVVTNKSPEGAYRGYGCTPHTLVIERLMDKAARQLGMDPVDIRRRNFIQPEDFPYKTPAGTDYDSGDYPALMDLALDKSDYEALRTLQAEKRQEGKLVGISAVFGIEPGGVWAMTGPYREWIGGNAVINPESAAISMDAAGRIDVEVYYALEGQGQYTFASQIVADFFGVPMELVRVRQADSKNPAPSMGPAGSRQAVALSGAVIGAARKLADKLKQAASILLQSPTEQLIVSDGCIRVNTDQGPSLPLGQVAAAMTFRPDLLPPDVDGNPQASHTWRGQGMADNEGSPYLTYASGCHVVLVEIDPATGQTRIEKYVIADDCGTRLNPASVEGQVQGGVAQGTGAALYEEYCFDEYGNPQSATYADYLMPTIFEVPMVEKHAMVTPSPNTELGVKGTGEGAIHVTPGAIFCAVNDALEPLGVELTHANAKPERVWSLIRQAASGTADVG
jgi:CO/xanthine dehydrogenase Mo-binding subunit